VLGRAKSVAVVTGASQGIGRATAVRLARDFDAVVLTARRGDELKTTAAAVESAGAEPQTYALDLRQPCSVDILVQGTLDRFGRIDALLNIAGGVNRGAARWVGGSEESAGEVVTRGQRIKVPADTFLAFQIQIPIRLRGYQR
jgi:NAD(P)-dependent dehydrogenase (short-subunit alcohol dehydrogenase family)